MNKRAASIRLKLYDYIRFADDRKLKALYSLLQDEIEKNIDWWKESQVQQALDQRYTSLNNGTDKGVTIEKVNNSIAKLRLKRYGRDT